MQKLIDALESLDDVRKSTRTAVLDESAGRIARPRPPPATPVSYACSASIPGCASPGLASRQNRVESSST